MSLCSFRSVNQTVTMQCMGSHPDISGNIIFLTCLLINPFPLNHLKAQSKHHLRRPYCKRTKHLAIQTPQMLHATANCTGLHAPKPTGMVKNYPVNRHTNRQVLTHSRTLPCATDSLGKLTHSWTFSFTICWGKDSGPHQHEHENQD